MNVRFILSVLATVVGATWVANKLRLNVPGLNR